MIRARPRVGPAAKRCGERVDLGVELVVVDRLPDQAPVGGALRLQRLAGQRQAERPRLADQPRQHPGAAAVRDQADRGEALDELGALRGDDDVAGQSDIGARAGRDAVDPRDHRHGQRSRACGSADCSAAPPTRRDRPPRPAPPRGRSDPARRRSRGRRRSAPGSAPRRASSSASATSSCICTVKLFSRSGRLSVRRAMPASSLNSIVS